MSLNFEINNEIKRLRQICIKTWCIKSSLQKLSAMIYKNKPKITVHLLQYFFFFLFLCPFLHRFLCKEPYNKQSGLPGFKASVATNFKRNLTASCLCFFHGVKWNTGSWDSLMSNDSAGSNLHLTVLSSCLYVSSFFPFSFLFFKLTCSFYLLPSHWNAPFLSPSPTILW